MKYTKCGKFIKMGMKYFDPNEVSNFYGYWSEDESEADIIYTSVNFKGGSNMKLPITIEEFEMILKELN